MAWCIGVALVRVTVTSSHPGLESINVTGRVIPRTLRLLAVAFTSRSADGFSVDGWLERRSRYRTRST